MFYLWDRYSYFEKATTKPYALAGHQPWWENYTLVFRPTLRDGPMEAVATTVGSSLRGTGTPLADF